MTAPTKEDADMLALKQHVSQLMNRFDTVHIFATRNEPVESQGTITATWGEGNYFTRYGQIRCWTVKQDERSRMEEREP